MDLTDRVRLLLNRYSKRSPIVPSEVEQVVGAPVMMTFPNDYARVANAITNGSTVDPKSELGIAYDDLAGRMVQRQSPKHAEPTRRFVDYFNISPARFSFERAKT
jgi:Flp pilus assembly CpaE family ATPase